MNNNFKLNRIGMKSLDRSGSNLILSVFHYQPEFFSLSEKFESDTKNYVSFPESKPAWIDTQTNTKTPRLHNTPGGLSPKMATALIGYGIEMEYIYPPTHIPPKPTDDKELIWWLHGQEYSMFSGYDNHIKNPDDVKNLIIKIPKQYKWENTTHRQNYDNAAGPYCELKYANHKYDKKFYLIRNPFRVALSIRPPEASKTPCDMLILKNIVDYTMETISQYKNDIEAGQNTKIVFLEQFLKNLETEAPKLINWADSDIQRSVDTSIGVDWSGNNNIFGVGGFNSNNTINYKRTLNRDINDFFLGTDYYDENLMEYAKLKLGNYLYDYWLYDIVHGYEDNLNLNLI